MLASFRNLFLACLLGGLANGLLADELPPVTDGRAQLLVIRPDHEPNEITLQVELNGQKIGELAPNRYFLADLEPGGHSLRVSGGETPVEEVFTVQSGEGAYFLITVEPGWWQYQMRMQSVNEEIAGRYLIKTEAAQAGAVVVAGVETPLAPAAATASAAASVAPPPAGHWPDISIVTLGVGDLSRAVAFYRDGLGFPLSRESSKDIAFFDLQGSWLALYPRQALAEDAGVPVGEAGAFAGFTLAHNVKSIAEVNAFMDKAVAAGAQIVKPAGETFWGGYSGYFRDPEGFLWEVAWNPHLSPD
jgi:catechol 2,3-dioxygenase-like lactoylglutathione lyase family enzyme